MNVFNKYFDKICVITASEHKNRIEYIKKYFAKENIKFDFLHAVNAKFLHESLLDHYYNYINAHNIKDPMNTSLYRVSATISHLQALRQLEYSDYDNILIFEDDVIFEENYQNNLELFMNNIPTDWDVLNLGRNYTYNQTQVEPYNEFSDKIKDLYGAHAYAVSKHNVKDFCDYMESPDMLFWGPDPILIMKYYRISNKCFAPAKPIVGALSEHYKDKNFIKTNECFKSFIS